MFVITNVDAERFANTRRRRRSTKVFSFPIPFKLNFNYAENRIQILPILCIVGVCAFGIYYRYLLFRYVQHKRLHTKLTYLRQYWVVI